jgi:glucosamine--fructose-6-phosphate aminotransferase (isomerizing)
MCGIVACISKEECSTILYDGLVQLKNRGYDSVGICTINNEEHAKFVVNKYASIKNIDIYNKLQEQLYRHEKAIIGIAHTRWATHGAKTDMNSHPHTSMCGKFMVVHNGIIENYKKLKQMLVEEKYVFQSQTDTEIIVQLLSFVYKKNRCTNPNITISECIEEMMGMLEGTWGLTILFIDEPETMYCVRHGSPLLVGYDDNIAIVVSEKSGFCNRIKKYFVLNNLDICKITNTLQGIVIDTKVEYFIKNVDNGKYDLTPEPYLHWTLKEIYEQPHTALQAINMGGRIINNDKVKLGGLDKNNEQLKKIDNLILLGCGTSYFAGQYGVHFFKDLCHFNTVQLFDGAEFNEKDIPKYGKTALLFISQSGETKDLHRCVEIGKEQNLLLIGLVNVVDSLIAREVDCGCYLNAGREVAVASTKAYTSQIILLSMIAVWFSQIKNINKLKRETYINDIIQLQYNIQNTLQMNEQIIDVLVEKIFQKCENCFLLGKGKSESVAKEGALKIKEISYIHSEGYSTSSLKHGPFALLNESFPVIIIAPNDTNYTKAENAYEEIKSRNAPIIFITDKRDQDKENVVYVPENKTFRDFLCVIPLQLLAYKIAVQRGINPDVPKNLAKVVTVE